MRTRTRLAPLLFASVMASVPAIAAEKDTPAQIAFFEKSIRPVLAGKCYKCHSAESEKTKGGLLLDTRVGIRKGGDSGPAIMPNNPAKSLLLGAIKWHDKDLRMPPEKEGGKLPEGVIQDFEKWIAMGAPDPREGGAQHTDTLKARAHWAYQPLNAAPANVTQDVKWPWSEIDRRLLAALESKRLAPVADAQKLTLIRRLYFDIIGLPPSFEDINAFLDDKSADAFAKATDRLLASPHFGERWGRHWLDVARYAESTGKDINITHPYAWRYRDYVIAAFNADKPYDQFIREQVAGDLLPAADATQRAEQIVATGFLAIGPKSMGEQNPRQFLLDVADEQIDTLSQAVLGTTISCARCHDHKFDPITQREYYALAGIFTSTDTRYGTTTGVQNRRPAELTELPAGSKAPTLGRTITVEERKKIEKQLEDLQTEQRDIFIERAKARATNSGNAGNLNALRNIAQTGQVQARLRTYDTNGVERALAMAVAELPKSQFGNLGGNPRGVGGRFAQGSRPPDFSIAGDCALYTRGEVSKPAGKVPRGFPAALSPVAAPTLPRNSSGRLELADWLVNPKNPLTARVYANRVWGWLFGRGLVDSPDNFGVTGSAPSNPALLDHLAQQLIHHGWSTKKLIREIVLSHTYHLSTEHNQQAYLADPENALHWRMTPRWLEAESLRDAMLTVSGELDMRPPVGSLVARSGETTIQGGPRGFGLSEDRINGADFHRSVYLPIVRDLVPEVLDLFDFPDPSLMTGKRESTSVPGQALFMLNSPFVAEQSSRLAARILKWQPEVPAKDTDALFRARVEMTGWLVFSRAPTETDRRVAGEFFAKHEELAIRKGAAHDSAAVWTSYCRALFASAEFRSLN
ncbi:MAG: DUF1549 domain-containing protein [Pedosphaera sp.]|nr:DUF1549 domain-containing protein [Pedosphaera sp.]